MANISGASLAQIQQRLRDTPAYHPFDADTFCDWAMEAGDIVTVRRGEESYQSPVHSSHLVWRGKQNMELNASGTKERDAIARVSKQKYARGGYGMRQQKSLYYEFYSEDGYLHSYIQMSESILVTHFDNSLSDLHSEFSQTAEKIQSSVWANESLIYSTVEQTATYIKSEVASAESRMGSSIYQTASGIRSDVWAAESLIYSTIEQTASNIRAEVISAESRMGSSIEMAASGIRSEVWAANSTIYSTIEQTASRIDQTVAQQQNDLTELKGRVIVEAGKASLVAEITDNRPIRARESMAEFQRDPNVIWLDVSTGKYYEWKSTLQQFVETEPNKVIKAGDITTAINEAGETEAHINAQKVYIGNEKSTTVISGKLNASDLTADLVTAKLALAENVNVKRLSLTNNGYIVLPTGDGNISLTGASAVDIIKNLRIQLTGNTYTLQKITLGDASWQDVGSFSRAISSASWEWTNGMPKVTLSPQDQSFTGRQITYGTPYQDSQDNDRWKMEIVEIDTSTTPPRYVTIPGRTIPLWNYLEAKTGTAKITSNGTFTPGTGKIGFSSVEVDVDATVTGAWEQSNPQSSANPYNKYTVRKGSGAVALSETVNVTQSYDSTTHQYTATVSATNRASVITAVTGTDAYTDGVTAGGTEAGLTIDTTNHKIKRSTSSKVKEYPITVSCGTPSYNSSTHKYSFSADAKADTTTVNTGSTSSGTEAYDAGYGAAHLTGSWDKTTSSLTNNNRITISKTTSGSSNSLNYVISAAASIEYDATTHKYTARAKAKVDGTQRGDDATDTGGTEAYNAGLADEKTLVRTRFNYMSHSYYVEAYENTSSASSISQSATVYRLGLSGTTVQIQNTSGNRITNTPEYSIPLEEKTITANSSTGYTPSSGYVGFSKVKVAVPNEHSISVSGFTSNGTTDPGSAFTNITGISSSSSAYTWFKFNAYCGSATKAYKIKVSDTARTIVNNSNTSTNLQGTLTAGKYINLKNSTETGSGIVQSWYVPNAWFYAGSKPNTSPTVNEMASNDYYLWIEYHTPNGRVGSPVGNTVWHINVPSSGATLDYIGADPNRPADAYILNSDKQPYVITSAKTTYWFLIRAMSGTTIIDSKYLGVGTNVSSGGGHNNAITFTRGALYAPNVYTWSAQIGTNVTNNATKFDFYY